MAIIAAAIGGLNLGFVAGCVWCDWARTNRADEPENARDRFMNALRILLSIDGDELDRALGRPGDFDVKWCKFSTYPFYFLIHADDETVDAIWSIIERRQPDRLKTGETK
jgi:hypothetical protein